ncbi:conserved hypothetical protein [Candidatus Competibacter denitrificans Run_A_D11]|uniref:Uncharacterized protein n=2 Tax=Candidatus Competibacter TaxID=221279 RepID=W6MAM4_9GAMM|nr:conserved hypothetical protein [Candidatus Competibacter denitrificans Run_A_D11]
MPRKPQSKGKCVYCGYETTKGSMTKHLSTCSQRRSTIEQSDSTQGASEPVYHLRVQSLDVSDFWLHLEIRGSAPLKELDRYLRAIWLECCGHLSQFGRGGGWDNKVAKTRQIQAVFTPEVELVHIYDFGTTSETSIKMAGLRQGKPTTKHPIALMARNLMPEAQCTQCGKPAVWLCIECLIEHEVWGTLCDEHIKQHPHNNYGEPIEIVNSPRLGLCGYTGPADPPY